MAADDDAPVELTVRLPAEMVRRVELLTPGARLPDVLKEGVAALLEAAENAPDDATSAAATLLGPADTRPGSAESPPAEPLLPLLPLLPVLAVGEAALVLERLDRVQASVTELAARLAESEVRERQAIVWLKTLLAELFAHTTPFATAADERACRLAAAERLGRVDARVRAYVENGRDLNGSGNETPPTS